jgi:hypothetical protein
VTSTDAEAIADWGYRERVSTGLDAMSSPRTTRGSRICGRRKPWSTPGDRRP